MKGIGNILWLILGGLVAALIYFLVGVVLFCTIIGIPFGIQLFKLGEYALWPFGRELVNKPGEPGCVSVVMNLLWILLGWWEVALVHLVCGLVFCITIVGIPFGLQHFRMGLQSVFPFGKEVRTVPE
ncbi:MAG: YccF domain-containing protein [Bacteroidales bacterium]|nr:YccF domain-containing protein [Bacteroidales bacterium]